MTVLLHPQTSTLEGQATKLGPGKKVLRVVPGPRRVNPKNGPWTRAGRKPRGGGRVGFGVSMLCKQFHIQTYSSLTGQTQVTFDMGGY